MHHVIGERHPAEDHEGMPGAGGEPLHAGLLDQQLVNEGPRFAAGPLDLDQLDAAAVAASQS